MKIVNNSKLPDVIFKYLSNDFYDFTPDKNSISATGLLKPIRETILTNRHNSEIEIDCVDRLWSLFGTGVHQALEKGNLSTRQEERISVEFEGFKVSGKFDIIDNGYLKDWKTTSAFTLVYGSRLIEWAKQLSIYRWLYWKKHGKELPDIGYVIAILRDWATRDAGRINNYPDSPIKEIELKLLSLAETTTMIVAMISNLKTCNDLPDDKLPVCTEEETWEGKKCEKYCVAASFCNCRIVPEVKKKKEKK
jgi:hypothetical protein